MRTRAERIRFVTAMILLVIMLVEFAAALATGQPMIAMLVAGIIAITMGPLVFRDRLPVVIPTEFQMLAILFVFASLFLGEIRAFYVRVWWWDMALHAFSGLLLGMTGFLLVYVLNENERANLHMKSSFIALFAFMFAVTIGALWEIFEFTMDKAFGMQMQKPMMGDPSGLTDTMWDLILDAAGALVICLFAWIYMRRQRRSFIDDWIRDFIESNPGLFRKRTK